MKPPKTTMQMITNRIPVFIIRRKMIKFPIQGKGGITDSSTNTPHGSSMILLPGLFITGERIKS